MCIFNSNTARSLHLNFEQHSDRLHDEKATDFSKTIIAM